MKPISRAPCCSAATVPRTLPYTPDDLTQRYLGELALTAGPEAFGFRYWIELVLTPPCLLITRVVQGSMVQAAERDRERVARLEPQATRFQEFQVMCLAGTASADETGLFGNRTQMLFVTHTAMERQTGLGRLRCRFLGLQHLQPISGKGKSEWMRSARPDRCAAEADELS